MQQLRKSSFILGVLFVVLFSNLFVTFQPTYAASFTYYDGKGKAQTISEGDNTRLRFVDPFTVLDKKTKTVYKTAATACDDHNMYVCSGGESAMFHESYYWFWPSSNGKPIQKPVNGKCPSGIVHYIQNDGNDGNSDSTVYIVNSEIGPTGGCVVKNTDGDIQPDKKITDKTDLLNAGKYITVTKSGGINKQMLVGASTFLYWESANTIRSYLDGTSFKKLDPKKGTAVKDLLDSFKNHNTGVVGKYASGYTFYANGSGKGDGCFYDNGHLKAVIAVSDDKSQVAILHQKEDNGNYDFSDEWQGGNQSCMARAFARGPNSMWGGSHDSAVIGIGDIENATGKTVPGGGGSGADSGNADVAGEADEPSCEVNGTNPLSWGICPIINGMGDLVDWIFDSFIYPLLETPPLVVNPNSGMFKVWSGFRLIANIILVIVFLVMIFGQAIGGGLVDAYTVKKVMPRVVIGAIGINLSIYLSP